jgi:hypothetical protein
MEVVVAWSHASVSAFLFQGMRKEMISGLSGQTLLAMTMCAVLAFAKKLAFPISDFIQRLPFDEEQYDREWVCETVGWLVDASLLLGCMHMLYRSSTGGKMSSNDKENEDDFGRSHIRYVWYNVLGRQSAPPAYFHWHVVYLATMAFAVLAVWGQARFSLSALATWVWDGPTSAIALFVDFLRGIGLLPQLHMSRRAGQVAPCLAIWIAMKGVIDVIEVLADGIVFDQMCFLVGDILSLLAVSDFMWIFIKAKLRGQVVVELPLEV